MKVNKNHLDIVDILLENGAMDLKNEWNQTALTIAKEKEHNNILDTLHEPIESNETHCMQTYHTFLKTALLCEHFGVKIEFICVPVHEIPNFY